jgi:thiamine biosynthesis lipoprotein
VTAPGIADRGLSAKDGPLVSGPARAGVEADLVSVERAMLGGLVGIHLYPGPAADAEVRARLHADRLLDRMEAWAARLTRFSPTSDLVRLNAWPSTRAPVRPTLAAVMDWGREAQGLSDGIVDIALLDLRLEAEGIGSPTASSGPASPAARRWSMARGSRRTDVLRPIGLTFDLDGVAKGWLADRALRRLADHPSAVVDADGDIAIRLGPGRRMRFGVADPRPTGGTLVELELGGPTTGVARPFGLATSGTSVHRWTVDGRRSHHLIDPRTGRPARTDLVQATVLARSAREAEAVAKTAVIVGSEAALERLDRDGIHAAILLTERGDVLVTPSTLGWLA